MAAGRQRKPLPDGSRAPSFTLPRLDNGEARLEDLLANGPVLLAFFKVSCPVCQLTLPYLDRLHATGVQPVYGISQNDPDETRDFNRRFGVTFPVLLDTEESGFPVSDAYHIASVPTMFLVERDGTISRLIEGWSRRDIDFLGRLAGISVFRPDENVPEWKAG